MKKPNKHIHSAGKELAIFLQLLIKLAKRAYSFVKPYVRRGTIYLKKKLGAAVRLLWRQLINLNGYLKRKWPWYANLQQRFKLNRYSGALLSFLALFIVFGLIRSAFAADLTNIWGFGSSGDYQVSTGAEVSGGTGHLKPFEYASDANTAALYHLNETIGTAVADSSSNNNTAAAVSPTWNSGGKLNYSLSLNGTTAYASAPDSTSLSITGANTLEAWTKFGSGFSNTSASRQTVLNKGAYQLYYDNQTGKITYELANSTNVWTQVGGPDATGTFLGGTWNNSWDVNSLNSIDSLIKVGSYVYASTGQSSSDATVWRWDGTDWLQVGGRGVNGSWPATTPYQIAPSMTTDGTNLYVGLGNGTGNAEVWRWNGSTWAKIGGDGLNGTWNINYESVHSLAANGTTVYAGLGTNVSEGEVWQCTNCSTSPTWTQIGGDGLNSGPAGSVYESVSSMHMVGSTLVIGLGTSAGDAEVWSWNGTTWTKLGGDGTGSAGQSWDSTFEIVQSIWNIGNVIYTGLGTGTGDAEVWSCDISTTCSVTAGWTKIGGDGVNTSWNTNYERV